MYDTSSSAQPAPDEESGPVAERGPSKARKLRESVLKDEKIGASKALKTREKKTKETIIQKRAQKERMEMKEIRDFWQEIFGKGALANFFISLNAFLAGEDGTFDAEAFDKEISARAKELSKQGFNMDEFVVSHRALGYGRHRENSAEGLEAALSSGEKQIEIDIRKGPDGKLYLSHDPIKKADTKKLLSIDRALEIFAESRNQNVAIFFDVKEPGVMKLLDAAIASVDQVNQGRPDYRLLRDRHFILSFDRNVIREAKRSNSSRPLIYYYFPTARFGIMSGLVSLIGRRKVRSMLGKADAIGGTRTSDSLKKTATGKRFDTRVIWHNLPDRKTLSAIRNSNGYLCIPAPLATKALIRKIKEKGIKVAVWGANDSRIKKMITNLGVDLVITDTPKAASKKPKRMAA